MLTETITRLERAVSQPDPELLTPKATALALSVSIKTVYRMVTRGQLRTVQVGRHWRVPRAEVLRFATPKAGAPRSRQQVVTSDYDARAEFEKTIRRLGGRR